jgi:glycosyltransferase involved in cell wall biosynthesis
MSNIVIVVPCHDEVRRLNVAAFHRFALEHKSIKFLLVNDGSRDGTLDLLRQIAAHDQAHFEVLHLPQNSGKAEAVRQGVLQAALCGPNAIGFWDADLATPLEAIPDFVAALHRQPNVLAVMGVRLPLLGHDIRRRPVRRWLGEEFAQVVSLVFGRRFRDTQCGAKLFRVTPETLAAFSQPFSSRWIFDVEVLARLKQLLANCPKFTWNDALYELPLERWEDVAGSKLKRGDFFKAISELAVIWWRHLRPAAQKFISNPTIASAPTKAQSPEIRRAA